VSTSISSLLSIRGKGYENEKVDHECYLTGVSSSMIIIIFLLFLILTHQNNNNKNINLK